MGDPPVSALGSGMLGGFVAPMLPTAGPVPTGAGWAIEIKFDGVRATSHTSSGRLRLFSRNARDISVSYPEIGSAAAAHLDENLMLDGELVASTNMAAPTSGSSSTAWA